MIQLPEDGSTIIIVQQRIVLVGLVGGTHGHQQKHSARLLFLAATGIGEPVGMPAGSEVGVGGVVIIEDL